MTLAQLEERVAVLEKVVGRLQSQIQVASKAPSPPTEEAGPAVVEEDFIPGTECPIVLSKPPEETIRCEAIIKWVDESAPQGLGLSDAEWASLGLEQGDE